MYTAPLMERGTWFSGDIKLDDLLAIGGRFVILRGGPVSIVATRAAYERFVREWSAVERPDYNLYLPTTVGNIYGCRLLVEATLSEAREHTEALIKSGHRVFLVAA